MHHVISRVANENMLGIVKYTTGIWIVNMMDTIIVNKEKQNSLNIYNCIQNIMSNMMSMFNILAFCFWCLFNTQARIGRQ